MIYLLFFFILFYGKSTKGIKRLTKDQRALIHIPNDIGEILVGIMLSDGHIVRRSLTSNPRFVFSQSGKKRVPDNIMDVLTPVGLAHWIMGDGSRHNLGLHLSVYAFTLSEVQLLINVLELKFGLKCSIHKHSTIGGKPRIYIWQESMIKLRLLVNDHIIPSMKYKLHK